MSLVDLSSDLSKFRSEVSKESKNTPETSQARNSKNFAAFQPITEKLSSFSPKIQKTTPQRLEKKLDRTKLDDVRKIFMDDLTINSVSKFSSINKSYQNDVIGRITTEEVVSKFNNIRQTDFISRLDVSNVVVTQSNLMSNKKSMVSINRNPNDSSDNISNPNINVKNFNQSVDRQKTSPEIVVGKNEQSNNIVNPNTIISPFVQSLDREKSSPLISQNKNDASDNVQNPDIKITRKPFQFNREDSSPFIKAKQNDQSDNIVNPNVEIQSKPQTFDRKKQSVLIKQDLLSPINNIINPEIALQKVSPISDRVTQTPSILTTTVQSGLVTNPDTQTVMVKNGTYHLVDESRLNIDNQPVKFISRGVQSIQTTDNSRLNVDKVSLTNPSGRNENPLRSKYSVGKKMKAVNFFTDFNAKGFVIDQQQGTSYYKPNSVYSWKGKRENAPTTNFITDVNGKGFTKFAAARETKYNTNSSEFSFINVPETNFFDQTKRNTTTGFKSFVIGYESDYIPDSSRYSWKGDKTKAPETNFLDTENFNTSKGFEKFSQSLISRYKDGSSVFDWDGKRGRAPGVDFFDKEKKNTRSGFQVFSRKYLSYYIPDSSEFNWDGKRINAPATDFFDVNQLNTISGFDTFKQALQSKYQPDSSRFQWKGSRVSAPATDFFDRPGDNTLAGFHTFAQVYDSKYKLGSSALDWDGARIQAPQVNYFDVLSNYTSRGFESFTTPLLSRYVKESSKYDWDGSRQQAPEVNYFDVLSKHTSKGFERFPQNLITRYVKESSKYDWDGSKQQSPEVNFFDLTSKFTSKGFERFSRFLNTRYVKESSQFDWNGTRISAPQVNYFENKNATGFTKLVEKLRTEYKRDSSEFVFKGTLPKPVDFFDIKKQFSTGFTNRKTSLTTEYKKNSSRFDFDGTLPSPVDFFSNTKAGGFSIKLEKLRTKYKRDTSEFSFKGSSRNAPAVNYFPTNQYAVGFTTFPVSYITKYKRDVTKYSFKGSIPLNKRREEMGGVQILRRNQRPGSTSFIFSPFFIRPDALVTEFIKDSSRYGWRGSRQDAPEVDFFNARVGSIQQGLPSYAVGRANGLPSQSLLGFVKLSDNPRISQLSDTYSFLSFPGATRKANTSLLDAASSTQSLRPELSMVIPATRFFGFTPNERNGFMLKMNSPYSTMYPIIEPRLNAFDNEATRYEVEGWRQFGKRVQTGTQVVQQGQFRPVGNQGLNRGGINNNAGQASTVVVRTFPTYTTFNVNKTSDNHTENGALYAYAPNAFFVRAYDGFNPANVTTLLNQLTTRYNAQSPSAGNYFHPYGDMVKYTREDPRINLNPDEAQYTIRQTLRGNNPAFIQKFKGSSDPNTNAHGVGFGYMASWYTSEGYWTTKKLKDRGYYSNWWTFGRVEKINFLQETGESTPLNMQYMKYKLQDEAVNNEPGALFNQPYVVRGIQERDRWINNRWGLNPTLGLERLDFGESLIGNILTRPFAQLPQGKNWGYDEGIVRGGILVTLDRTVADFTRTSKFLASLKGLMFVIKQFGLQAMNPTVDVDPTEPKSGIPGIGLSSTLIFNPALFLGNFISNRIGLHLARHGGAYPRLSTSFPFVDFKPLTDSAYLNKYEKTTINREKSQQFISPEYESFDNLPSNGLPSGVDVSSVAGGGIASSLLGGVSDAVRDVGGYSRLIGLMKELLPGTFEPNNKNYSNKSKDLVQKSDIKRLSTVFGGPQSFFGFGGTKFTRARHPYLTFYTTAPNLSKSNSPQHEVQYTDGAKKDIFFSAFSRDGNPITSRAGVDLYGFRYQDAIRNEMEANSSKFFGLMQALSYTLSYGPKYRGSAGQVTGNYTGGRGVIQGIQVNDWTRIDKYSVFDPRHPSNLIQRTKAISHTKQTDPNKLHESEGFAKTPSKDAENPTSPIKQYRTLNYDQLTNVVQGNPIAFNDFRKGIIKPFVQNQVTTAPFMTNATDPNNVDYTRDNLEQKFGLGRQGKLGARRDIPGTTNIEYVQGKGNARYNIPQLKSPSSGSGEFRGDRINIIDRKLGVKLRDDIYEKGATNIQGGEDLIDFYFQSLDISGDDTETLVFRATFDSITDNHKPSWNSAKYMGRADPLYIYSGYEREISFGFTVHIGSRDEMRATWRKLNFLASWTTPEYVGAQLKGPLIRLTIGHLYRKLPGYISALTYTFDNTQTTWETAKLPKDMDVSDANSGPGVLQLPKTINISVSYVPVGNYRPEWNSVMYSLFDDDKGKNTGVVPTGNTSVVNYFNESYPAAANAPVVGINTDPQLGNIGDDMEKQSAPP